MICGGSGVSVGCANSMNENVVNFFFKFSVFYSHPIQSMNAGWHYRVLSDMMLLGRNGNVEEVKK